jgi:hypothetical protein
MPEVAGVSIVIVSLDIADAAVIVLKLTLNGKVGVIWPRQIEVSLAMERDLEVLATRFAHRHAIGVQSHGM